MRVKKEIVSSDPYHLYYHLSQAYFINSLCINSGETPITKNGEHYRFYFVPEGKDPIRLSPLEFDTLIGVINQPEIFSNFQPEEYPSKSSGFYHYLNLKRKLIPLGIALEKKFLNKEGKCVFSYCLSEFAKNGEYIARLITNFKNRKRK